MPALTFSSATVKNRCLPSTAAPGGVFVCVALGICHRDSQGACPYGSPSPGSGQGGLPRGGEDQRSRDPTARTAPWSAQTTQSPTARVPMCGSLLAASCWGSLGSSLPQGGDTSEGTEAGWGQDEPTSQSKATGLGCLEVSAPCPTSPAGQHFACRGPLGVSKPFFIASPFTRCQDVAAHGREPSQAGQNSDQPQRGSSGMGGQDPQSPFPSAPRGQ